MTVALTLEEKHHYGMCGGACRCCQEDAENDYYERMERERAYRHEQDEQERVYAEACFAEEWWLEWLRAAA